MSTNNHKRGGGWKHRGGGGGRKDRNATRQAPVDSNNPIIAQFQTFAGSLDYRHDKRERLIKLSRDVTIESKRIIFLLHRVNLAVSSNDEDDEEGGCFMRHSPENVAILDEADSRIKDVQKNFWKFVATELEDEDPWFYLRAYTAGLQEYVEAVSFYHHLRFGGLVSWNEVQSDLTTSHKEPSDGTQLTVMVPRSDYMLGIADLTGEVMRQAINSAGSGNTKLCFTLLNFLQELHDGFVGLTRDSHREIPKKLHVMQSSLRKVETVCYNINVRGTEVPSHLLGTYMELSNAASAGVRQSHTRDFDNQQEDAIEDI